MEKTKIKKCRVCGCTENNACKQKDGNACYWVFDDLCSNCRKIPFTFLRNGSKKPEVYHKTEPELTNTEQDLLYNDLLKAWQNSTRYCRNRLIKELFNQINQ